MPTERAKGDRITFERGLSVQILGLDGSWSRDGTMVDVSEIGAKLTLAGPADEAALKEFFLLLSTSGLAYRRCELAWVDGEQIGVNFIRADDRKAPPRRRAEA